MNEAAYREGLKSALDILRPLAQSGEREACIIVDRQTGAHLDFQTGERDEVSPDWSKIPQGAKAAVLHTHPLNIAFGPEDWDVLANHAELIEIQAICPAAIFRLVKPDGWEFQTACKAELSVLGSVFERLLIAVRVESTSADSPFESRANMRAGQIYETNQRMTRSVVARGFRFYKE